MHTWGCIVLGRTWQHASPTFSPHTLCLIWGLSSAPVTQCRHPCSLMALIEPGLTRKDRLSHVAGDAPLACCLSLNLTAVSWPPCQPDTGATEELQVLPFLSMTPQARVQEHYSYYCGWWVRGLITGSVAVSSLNSLSICARYHQKLNKHFYLSSLTNRSHVKYYKKNLLYFLSHFNSSFHYYTGIVHTLLHW